MVRRTFARTLVLMTLIATMSATPTSVPPTTSAVRLQLVRSCGMLTARSSRTSGLPFPMAIFVDTSGSPGARCADA